MSGLKEKIKTTDNLTFRFMLATVIVIIVVMGMKYFWDYNGEMKQAEREMLEKAQIITEQQKALWEFMAINQRKINYDLDGNLEYKFLSCSTVAMGVGAMLAAETDYRLKPTNTNYRNILNAPDAFEAEGIVHLKQFPSTTEYWVIDDTAGKQVFRYMTPLTIDKFCLDCHGEPKGEIDISGYAKEGLKVGEFAGALSLTMPMDIYMENMHDSQRSNAFFFFLLIVVCITCIYFLVTKMVTSSLGELEHAVSKVGAGQWDINLKGLKAKGEIRRLTNHFQSMTEQLKDLYTNLELKVEQRTDDLEKANLILKKHQNELEQMNLRLEETNVHKSEFLAVMSHELRTPLTSIIAFTELLLVDMPPKSENKLHILEDIQTNSQILLRLINNILDLAKIEAGKDQLNLEIVDMQDIIVLVESVITTLAKSKEIDLSVHVDSDVPLTKADPEKIRRIIENLAGNAVKFTDPGGRVEISVQYDPSSNEIILLVNDNGIGIKEDAQKYIFEKFTQADSSSSRKYGGTGLGLSLAKELVELHQGWIKVESQYGGGSRFIVGIPVQNLD
ncbi:ATP-binding protein [Desulfitobacterium sp. THU1]|uniref:ATP-binding protein n=2 Tax=Desulfitobacterium sp. THU1 TaxID=3138072 RepID=UPI00311ED2D1